MAWAMAITGFIVGIPLFYGVGFVLLVPIIFAVIAQYRLPALVVGVPACAAMSVAHGLLPPHPAPTALVATFNANLGLKKNDLQMLEDLQHLKKPVQVVLTKLDKIKYDADIVRVVTDTTSQLQRYNKFVFPMVHLTSAHHLFGVQDLRAKFAIGFQDQLKV